MTPDGCYCRELGPLTLRSGDICDVCIRAELQAAKATQGFSDDENTCTSGCRKDMSEHGFAPITAEDIEDLRKLADEWYSHRWGATMQPATARGVCKDVLRLIEAYGHSQRFLEAEKEQCARMGARNVEAMTILGGSYPEGIVERAKAVVEERDKLRADYTSWSEYASEKDAEIAALKKQNALMLKALKDVQGGSNSDRMFEIASEALEKMPP